MSFSGSITVPAGTTLRDVGPFIENIEISGNRELPIEQGRIIKAAKDCIPFLLEVGRIAGIDKGDSGKVDENTRIKTDVKINIAGHVNSEEGSPVGNGFSINLYCSNPLQRKLSGMMSDAASEDTASEMALSEVSSKNEPVLVGTST